MLNELPWVSTSVASAILTWVHPRRFTVIDRQAYRALCVEFPTNLSPNEYLHYLKFCQEHATALGICLRSYDRALWQLGGDLGRIRKDSKKPATETEGHTAKTPAGITAAVKRVAWQNPKWNSQQIMAALEREGLSPKQSTVETVAADFRHTLRVLRALGVIKES